MENCTSDKERNNTLQARIMKVLQDTAVNQDARMSLQEQLWSITGQYDREDLILDIAMERQQTMSLMCPKF